MHYDIDAKVTVTVERWRRVAQLARVDLDAAAGDVPRTDDDVGAFVERMEKIQNILFNK
jgi:hypothetical protein